MVSRVALVGLVLVALATGTATLSGADFAAGSASPGNAFAAAADFNTVAVTIDDPGGALSGTVALTATASSERGIDHVSFETAPAGTQTWTDACEATAAPYSCDWDSTGVADGARDVRAVAVDQAGYERTAVVAARLVDNTLPSATLSDPGIVTGSESLTATGADTGSGLASLAIAYRPAAGAWTTLCTGATSPRMCSLDSTPLADGAYELRARAVDGAGNERDTVLTRTVDNTAPSGEVDVPAAARGTVAVDVSADDGAGSGVAQVTARYRAAGGSTWTTICVDSAAPYSCAGLNTTTLTDGFYDVQAVIVDNAGFSTTTATATMRVDNATPATVTLTNPGTPLSGTVALSGSATDAGSGIASWTAQYRPSGGSTWTDACADTASPFGSCSWSTAALTDGLYDLRAIATDAAGNTRTSTTITNRRVDNLLPTVALTSPAATLTGTVTLTATASDASGITSVAFQRSPAGANTWTTICTDTSSAYSCSFNTTAVGDGSYDLRARATDTTGKQQTSVASARTIENVNPFGSAIQAGNGGATVGRLEAGDWISLTWNEPLAPASILSGWPGAAQAIRVTVTNSTTNDRMDFYNATGTTRLNLVNSATDLQLNGNFVAGTVWFDATMVQTGSTITVTLGARISGTLSTASAGTMRWRPSANARDLANKAGTTTQVTESGTADTDF